MNRDYGEYVEQCKLLKKQFPAQSQPTQPGLEYQMEPKPIFDNPNYKGSGKLKGKVAIITGGDSGIGRAVSVAYAKEGAKVVICYYDEHQDAKDTKEYIEKVGGECILISGDERDPEHCKKIMEHTMHTYKKIDILVNNTGVQFPQDRLEDISIEQFDDTFKTNIYSYFYMTKFALPYMKEGASIINTTSVVTYAGEKELIDYTATKGAIVGFTRSLALNLVDRKIRVNGIAPGFIWTPLQPSSWDKEQIPTFGAEAPMGRAGQPFELAPSYVYLASEIDSGYVTGQILHINGGLVMPT